MKEVFFIKNGNNWTEYRPKEKAGIWASYTQYNEEANYYNISNNSATLAIPKTSNNDFYKRENGNWKVIYKTRVVYDYFKDSSVHLFCFTNGYYVRDGNKWRLYLPKEKEGVWCTFNQYKEDDNYFYLKNELNSVCVPKGAHLKCFIWNDGKWEENYSITEIYDHI